MRKLVASTAVAAALLGGGATAGYVLAAPGLGLAADSTPTPSPAPLPDSATLPVPFATALQDLVKKGTITQKQADAVAEALKAARPDGFGRHAHGLRLGLGRSLATAAKTIGISEDALRTALQGGKTLAQVAEDHGVKPQRVVDALVKEMNARLDAAVKAGQIDSSRAAEERAEIAQRAKDIVNGVRPGLGLRGFGRHGFGWGKPGAPDEAPSAPEQPTTPAPTPTSSTASYDA